MKTIVFCITAVVFSLPLFAQDYVAVVAMDDVTYYYPEKTIFRLYDSKNEVTLIEKDKPIEVSGDYRLEADVFWKDTPEIIKSNGGSLAIYFKENNYFKSLNGDKASKKRKVYGVAYNAPREKSRDFSPSKEVPGTHNVSFAFSNGINVSYADGVVIANQNGRPLQVKGHYIIYGKEDILKLSYNPKNKEVWYYFEKNKK